MIIIIGRFQIKAGEKEAFLKFAKEAIEHQKHVKGCLSFEVLQDLVKQDAYVMLETWDDSNSLNRHFDTEAYLKADEILNDLVEGEVDWQEIEV
jgi:quinol monooxygenase YgiN